MIAFIDRHRRKYGVEPICRVLPISPSTHHAHKPCHTDPTGRPARVQQDAPLQDAIERVWKANHGVYSARNVWHQFRRDGTVVARCTVEPLMRRAGLAGVVRGRRARTTIPADGAGDAPRDLVQRTFSAERPNQLWVAAFMYVATWSGSVYVAFVIDVCSRFIVGWRASRSMRTDLALDALDQALYARETDERLIHHSNRGGQCLSIRYTELLQTAGIEASVGRRGDAYDNALAESVIGLLKTEVIRHAVPWRGIDEVA